eukprot:3633520-Amphidinium_carterae.2
MLLPRMAAGRHKATAISQKLTLPLKPRPETATNFLMRDLSTGLSISGEAATSLCLAKLVLTKTTLLHETNINNKC